MTQQEAEEVAARFRAAGARDCTALMVLRFLAPMDAAIERFNGMREEFGLTRAEIERMTDD